MILHVFWSFFWLTGSCVWHRVWSWNHAMIRLKSTCNSSKTTVEWLSCPGDTDHGNRFLGLGSFLGFLGFWSIFGYRLPILETYPGNRFRTLKLKIGIGPNLVKIGRWKLWTFVTPNTDPNDHDDQFPKLTNSTESETLTRNKLWSWLSLPWRPKV